MMMISHPTMNWISSTGIVFPSFGPFSEEEAIARIEEAEKDLSDPSKWITSEQMWQQLYEEFPWLKTARTEESKGLD